MSAELKELAEIIRRLPPQKLELLLDFARDLAEEATAEDLAEFEAGVKEGLPSPQVFAAGGASGNLPQPQWEKHSHGPLR